MFKRARAGCAMAVALLLGLVGGVASADPGDALVVYGEDVPVYDAPRQTAGVLLRLHRGHALEELENRGSWVRVAVEGVVLPGKQSWMQASSVRRMQHEGETVASPGSETPGEAETSETVEFGTLPRESLFLDVTGSAPRYRAECRLSAAGADSRRSVSLGVPPERISFSGDTVSCRVQNLGATGELAVVLSQDEVVLATGQTTTPFGVVFVRSDGQSGPAWGIPALAGPGVVFVPMTPHLPTTPVPSFERNPVPSFQTNPVPPFASSPVPPVPPPRMRNPF